MNISTLITRSTSVKLDDVCARLPEIAARHKFGFLGVHDLRQKMESKGFPFDRECRVFEVCSPQQAHAILTGDITVSAALPCRISVYTDKNETTLASIDPHALLGLFGSDSSESREIAEAVKGALIAIMDQCCADSV